MQEPKKLTWFRQMEFSLSLGWTGVIFTAAGAYGVYVGLRELLTGSMVGLVVMLFTGLFMAFGLSLLLCLFRRVDITDKEVILRLWSIVLRRIPISQIRTLGVTTMRLNTRRWHSEVEVIVLTPHSALYMQKMAGGRGRDMAAYGRNATEVEKAHAITKSAIRAYLSGHMSGVSGTHLPKSEGIWLEYSPERAAQMVKLLPRAENYIY